MIISRIRGGLGNQLFQYAAGLALATHHHTTLKLDDYTYRKIVPGRHTKRAFVLNHLNVRCEIAGRRDVHRYTGGNPLTRLRNKMKNYAACKMVFAQPYFHYYEGFFELPSDIYLSGYWQSEKYFANVNQRIREEFLPREQFSELNEKIAREITSSESISIHVRRGDLANRQSYASVFGTLSTAYYRRAVDIVLQQMSNPRFFVFTDDPREATQMLDFVANKVFVTNNVGEHSFWDIMLMRRCRHNIIANSTFSWWGAWLNDNPDKLVIAPKQWFRPASLNRDRGAYAERRYDTRDLYPVTWIMV